MHPNLPKGPVNIGLLDPWKLNARRRDTGHQLEMAPFHEDPKHHWFIDFRGLSNELLRICLARDHSNKLFRIVLVKDSFKGSWRNANLEFELNSFDGFYNFEGFCRFTLVANDFKKCFEHFHRLLEMLSLVHGFRVREPGPRILNPRAWSTDFAPTSPVHGFRIHELDSQGFQWISKDARDFEWFLNIWVHEPGQRD